MSQQQDLEEKAKKIDEIFNEAMKKLDELEAERNKIISDYRRKLEQEKIVALQKELMN